MKSVLISIRPKWCEKIASGKKTIEVRKSRPKIETPFKCYIYVSKGDLKDLGSYSEWIYWIYKNRMKIIGEFVCDRIEDFSKFEFDYSSLLRHINLYAGTNGDYKFLDNYLKGKKYGYGWHVSDIKIYDKPKELSELCIPCKTNCEDCKKPLFYDCWKEKGKIKVVTRPPQSWQYVEERWIK